LQRFFSGASIGSPLSRTRSGECLAITNRTHRESQLDFCSQRTCVARASRAWRPATLRWSYVTLHLGLPRNEEKSRAAGFTSLLRCTLPAHFRQRRNLVKDAAMAADCIRHARMFFNRPDLDLAGAGPGSYALTPHNDILADLEGDYTAMSRPISVRFGRLRGSSRVL